MNLNIPLTPELDTRVREEAARLGVEPSEFVLGALQKQLSGAASVPSLSAEESRLLQQVNCGLSETQWRRYYELIEKRDDGGLTEAELQELIATSDRVEQLNARRLEPLAELAKLRGVSLPEMMDQLQITRPVVL